MAREVSSPLTNHHVAATSQSDARARLAGMAAAVDRSINQSRFH